MEISLTEFCKLPTTTAFWSHGYKDYDYWMTAREKERKGDLLVFECEHGRWVLLPARATVHGTWKAKWNQRVFKFPPEHKNCSYKIHYLNDITFVFTPADIANAIYSVDYEDDFLAKELSAVDMKGSICEWKLVFSVTRFVVLLRIEHNTKYTLEWKFDREFAQEVANELAKRQKTEIQLPRVWSW